jgi:hypothetical protein
MRMRQSGEEEEEDPEEEEGGFERQGDGHER